MILVTIYAVLFCSLWVLMMVYLMWTLAKIPLFHKEMQALSCEDTVFPVVSIIIPACNEAVHIEQALRTILAQDYPKLEVIAINDRSTDSTGDIINRLAENDARLKVLHIDELPQGWLGKVNALHQGVQQATGDWYLFTDADVSFEPAALRRAICYARHYRVNHLVCVPRISIQNFWLNIAVHAFGLMFLLSARAAEVNRENSKTPIGVGAFNLVEKAMFHRTPGFEWLRMEPTDDYGLGLMIKQAGGRTRLAIAEEDMSVPWYDSLGAMIKGVEKNMFGPAAQYSWAKLVLMQLFMWGLIAAPLVSFVIGIATNHAILFAVAGIFIGMQCVMAISALRKGVIEALGVLFFPLGILMISVMMLRSAYKCTVNDGIDWRGTHYSTKELRAGQRVKF